MKFVCLKCATNMGFEKVEQPAEGSLGVFFTCPSCDAKFSMVTNPGETQMVSSLGVQLGGRTVAPTPLEMTRGGLKEEVGAGSGQMAAYLNEKIQAGESPTPSAATAPAAMSGAPGQAGETTEGGCPFSAMVAQMGLGSTGTAGTAAPAGPAVTWTPDAQERLDKLPSFVAPMVRSSVETYARNHGFDKITLQVMDDSKNATDGMEWSPEAKERLSKIPDFIQPMAKKEIERLAKEQGATSISGELMEAAKEKFMKFM